MINQFVYEYLFSATMISSAILLVYLIYRKGYTQGFNKCIENHNIVDADEFEHKIAEGLKRPAVMTPTPKIKNAERMIKEYREKKGII